MSHERSPAQQNSRGRFSYNFSMLLSDRDVAAILRRSRATVWRRVADGALPRPIKLGGLSRFVVAEVMDRVEAAKTSRDSEAGE